MTNKELKVLELFLERMGRVKLSDEVKDIFVPVKVLVVEQKFRNFTRSGVSG